MAFCWCPCCLSFQFFVLSYYVFLVPCCDVHHGLPHKKDVRFVFTSSCLQEGSWLINVIWVCLRTVVSDTYCDSVYRISYQSHEDLKYQTLQQQFGTLTDYSIMLLKKCESTKQLSRTNILIVLLEYPCYRRV